MKNFFKHTLAILALIVATFIFFYVVSLVFNVAEWLVSLVGQLSVTAQVFIYILAGGTFLYCVFVCPILFGLHLLLLFSEAIHPSRNGTRYKVWFGFLVCDFFISFLYRLVVYKSFTLPWLYGAIFSIAAIIFMPHLLRELE